MGACRLLVYLYPSAKSTFTCIRVLSDVYFEPDAGPFARVSYYRTFVDVPVKRLSSERVYSTFACDRVYLLQSHEKVSMQSMHNKD